MSAPGSNTRRDWAVKGKDRKGASTAVNFFDWVLIALFAIGAFWGYRKGLIDAVLLVASIYVALLLSGQFAGRILNLIWEDAGNEAFATAVGYVVIFVGVFIAGRIVSRIIKSSLTKMKVGWADKAGGVLVGLLAGVLLSGGLMAVAARYTYVIDKDAAGDGGSSGGLSPEAIVEQLRESAEKYLVDSGRENVDRWLRESEMVPVLIDVRNVLPGSALGMYPEEFNTAIDILESKRNLEESATALQNRSMSMQSSAV
ncbi:MAG: CvpA family protein [Chloroflexi bacterium]|nr:CvpA family protein [Chloroflexota bacterium]MDA1296994.1 CvpA family protein [Chloroflexota bacterium]